MPRVYMAAFLPEYLFLQSAALTFFQLSSIMKIKSGELIAFFRTRAVLKRS